MPQCLFRRTRKTEKNHVEWLGDASDGKLFPPSLQGNHAIRARIAYSGGGRKGTAPSINDVTNVTTNITSSASMQLRRFPLAAPVFTVSILAALIGSAGLCWTLFPLTTSQIYPKSPVASALVGGVGAVGIISFLASIVTGDCGEPGPFGGRLGFAGGGRATTSSTQWEMASLLSAHTQCYSVSSRPLRLPMPS